MKKVYLLPGFYIATPEAMLISTLLGSCVAVAFYDPNKKIAGLCHYLISRIVGSEIGAIARYGDQAVPMLYDEMISLGARPQSIIAKVYGGANVLGDVSIGIAIGKKNISIAHELLDSMKIPIVKEDTGGNRGRKILLNTETFEVEHTLMSESPSAVCKPRRIADTRRTLVIDSARRSQEGSVAEILAESGLNVIGAVSDIFDAYNAIIRNKPDTLIFVFNNASKNQLQQIKDLQKMTDLPPFYIYSIGGTGMLATQALQFGARDFIHIDSTFDPPATKTMAMLLIKKIQESWSA